MQIHKLLAGLLEQYQLCGERAEHGEAALRTARSLADYFVLRIDSIIAEKGPAHWQVSGTGTRSQATAEVNHPLRRYNTNRGICHYRMTG